MFWVLNLVFLSPNCIWAEISGSKFSVEQLLGEIRLIETKIELSVDKIAENKKHSQTALGLLNIAEISKKALGKHWAKLDIKEQKKFQNLLGQLFIHVAFPSSAKFFAKLDLVYGSIVEKKRWVLVPLTVVHETEGEVGIDFKLIKAKDKWQIVDVVLDGVSMRNNLRSQFYKVIAKKNFGALMQKMEKKLEAAK